MSALATIAAIVASAILLAVLFLQILLAAGSRLGFLAWGGRFERLPIGLRIASALSTLAIAGAIWVALARVGLVAPGRDAGWVRAGAWVCVVAFTLNALGNFVSKSERERRIMTPAAAILALCYALIATS